MTTRTWLALVVACAVVPAVVARDAHAGYEDDQNNRHLGAIERAFVHARREPAIFDGKALAASVDMMAAENLARSCEIAFDTYNRYWGAVTAKGQASERGKTVAARAAEMQPYCTALRSAVDRAAANAKAAAEADATARAKRSRTCRALVGEASEKVGGSGLHDVLDTIAGRRTPTTAEHVAEFRAKFEALVGVCKQPAFVDSPTACKGEDFLQSSSTMARYDYGEVCAATVDATATLAKVATAAYEHQQKRLSEPPTLDALRRKEGWIARTDAIEHATYFTISEDAKQKLAKDATAMFDAAGVPAPSDLSALWAKDQANLDALKGFVHQLAGEWTIDEPACKGYTCQLAKKSVLEAHPKAKVKKVLSRNDWKVVVHQVTKIPEYRYQSIYVIYQVPGEPYCQVRQATANELYKGRRFAKTPGVQWGYVRWQACK